MGATTFITRARGPSADQAFRDAVSAAQYEHGHGGYTGTIAEKGNFVHVHVGQPAPDEDRMRYLYAEADRILSDESSTFQDKWGPAGCITVAEGDYLFFGWASE